MFQVRVRKKHQEFCLEAASGQKISALLQENGIFISNICHGNGTCGKCKIKVVSGSLELTEADKKTLSEREWKSGIRLSCKARVQENLTIEILDEGEDEIVVENLLPQKRAEEDEIFFLAADIGTTTIAMVLAEAEGGKVADSYTSLNHQRCFGADVISRIQASGQGHGKELKQLIEKDLWQGIQQLVLGEGKTQKRKIDRMIISGNTTMIHLLMGYSCSSLERYPFNSRHLEQIDCVLKECICFSGGSAYGEMPVTILPGISAFVGGDITAGILSCQGFDTDELCLLLDLGTNGEMVLGNKQRLLAASTAAGPAFEGGNIHCGTAGIPGAISQVKIQNRRAIVRTIREKYPPAGICGTGLISAISQLKKERLMNAEGLLSFPYESTGFPLWVFENGEKIALYQQDIREFQMAKAAIRAGIEVLMQEYGCSTEDICHVYLAGGFGTKVSEADAVDTGILPKEFKGKIQPVGNSALRGTILSYKEGKEHCRQKVQSIVKRTQTISLAETKEFQGKYLAFMNF